MDLLVLSDVAELLGEPESAIMAACRSFPEYVPVVGAGRGSRFPSIALDVLRLITDATAAGVPAAAITHLIESNFAAARDLANDIQAAPGGIPSGYEQVTAPFDVDELAEQIQEAVAADILPIVQMLTTELGITRATVEQMRIEMRGTARADDLERLRVETRTLSSAQESPSESPGVTSELAKIQADLRPALHGLDEIRLAVDGLREEMAALRWQLDQREQLGQLVAEMAALRTQVGRLDLATLSSDEAEPVSSDDRASATSETGGVEAHAAADTVDADAGDSTTDDIDLAAATPLAPEPDAPSAIITEFASRTPRRMGRTLFADEG